MRKRLRLQNFYLILAFLISIVSLDSYAQNTLAFQSFEGSGTWNYSPNPASYNTGTSSDEDIWGIVSSLSSITATDGTNFWGMQDLENSNGGGAFYHMLTFQSINIEGYSNVQLSFDYNVIEYDSTNGDDIRYVIVIDGTDAVTTSLTNDGSGSINYDVSSNYPNAESVGLRIEARQNGANDFAAVDNFSIEATTLNTNDLTSTVNAPTAQIAGSTVDANNVNSELNAVDVFAFEIQDNGDGDNLPTLVTQMRFTPGNSNTLFWGNDIQGVTLRDENNIYSYPDNIIIENSEIILEFDTPLNIADNDAKEFILAFYINETGITDNDVIQVEINSTSYGFNADISGSGFDAPYTTSNITGNLININVEATQLQFLQQPSDVNVNNTIDPAVQVAFTDINGNVDSTYTDETGTVNLTTNGSFETNAVNSVNANNGVATFDNLIFDTEQDDVVLTATHVDGNISGTYNSNIFNVTAAPEIIAIQDFDTTTPEWVFTADVNYFSNTNSYFGPIDGSAATGVNNPDFNGNIFYEQDLQNDDGGIAGFANITFDEILLENYDNVQFSFDYDIVGYNANNDDAKYELFYDGVGQGEVFLLDGGVDPQNAQGLVSVNIPDSVDEVYLVLSIRNNGQNGYSGFDNFILAGNPDTPQSFVFEDGLWTPENPQGISESDDDITIVNGNVIFNGEVSVNNLTVNTNAAVEFQDVLNLYGDINNNGDFTFVSISETQTGILNEVSATSTITGDITVERFIPEGRRAFRFLTSAVTTSTSINENWQEGVNNTGLEISDNQDPNPGYGIHITGSETGANGLDATPTGNPSLFTFDNVTQTWSAINNTNSNTLTAGEAYRVYVRGDRGIDVTSNEASSPATIIRATGELATGTITQNSLSSIEGSFNFIGNPYQAPVDMFAVLNNSNNVNTNLYYTWDPDLSDYGAYVMIEDDGTVTPSDGATGTADANTYLQPGQAAFVITSSENTSTSLIFEESFKGAKSDLTTVFRAANIDDIEIVGNLYTQDNFTNSGIISDGFRIRFSEDYSNNINAYDGVKPFNIDENFGVISDSELLIVEERELPFNDEEIQLFNNNYRNENYILSLNVEEFEGLNVYLKDNFTQELTLLETGVNHIPFSVNADDESSQEYRMALVFSNEENLGTQITEENSLVMYPNPIKNESLHIRLTQNFAYEDLKIKVTNMMGQQVYTSEINASGLRQIQINEANTWESGVYMISLDNGKNTITKKIIKQ